MEEKHLPVTHTTKKVKYVGSQQFINAETGEVEEFQVTNIEERDFNFSKVWMRNFVATLDLVGNQKTKLVYWIIDHLTKENQLICTNRQLEKETGISLKTVSVTMKVLQDANFLKKTSNGVYTVNPDVVFKGSRTARLNVLHTYQELGNSRPVLTDDEKIQRLKESISVLQNELDKLLTARHDIMDTDINGQLAFDEQGTIYEKAVMLDSPKRRKKKGGK